MHGSNYAVVCVLMLLLLMTISLQTINPVKAIYTGRDEFWGYASDIHTSAAGIDSPWIEDFEHWSVNQSYWTNSSTNGGAIAVITDWYAHSPSHDMSVSCSNSGSQAVIWNEFPISTYANVTVYIKFLQLSSSTDMELVDLQGAPPPNAWQSSADAVVTSRNGRPVWTLRTYEGGSSDSIYSLDGPRTGQWYKVQLIRDYSNGYAALYVNGSFEAYEYRTMAYKTWAFDTGICWQSGNGNNQLRVDDITESVNGDPTTAYEDNCVQWATDEVFGLFDGTYAYGHLENYMVNYHSYTNWDNVMGVINEDENYYDYATFLYIGHGGLKNLTDGKTHYDFLAGGNVGQDWNSITDVWDYDVNQHLGNNKDHYFVFLWTCRGGDILGYDSYWTVGMPYSWSDGAITSDNGYSNSDSSGYCLISFKNASPMLSCPISYDAGNQNYNQLYKYWLVFLYYYALSGYDVHDALNMASSQTGYYTFDQFPSYNYGAGNLVWWSGGGGPGMGPKWYPSTMRVYGDSSIYIP